MSEPFIGEIRAFGFSFAPLGWAFCDGRLLAASEHAALASLLGTFYGGDGRTTFALPDFRGRTPIHAGAGKGLTHRSIGQRSGRATSQTVPFHTHDLSSDDTVEFRLGSKKGTQQSATNGFLAEGSCDVQLDDGSSGEAEFYTRTKGKEVLKGKPLSPEIETFGEPAITNMQPYMVLNYCISLTGDYPSRD